jgi:beta-apo-4'-carotenal oxygenase
MSTSKPIPWESSQISQVSAIASSMRSTFKSQKAELVDYRILQLRKRYWAIEDNTLLILDACKSDLNKSNFETRLSEIDWCKNDIIFATRNLAKCMKDQPALQ